MEPLEKIQAETTDHYMVEIRFLMPNYVAEWFSYKAKEDFKHRNMYIRDLLIAIWRKANGR